MREGILEPLMTMTVQYLNMVSSQTEEGGVREAARITLLLEFTDVLETSTTSLDEKSKKRLVTPLPYAARPTERWSKALNAQHVVLSSVSYTIWARTTS